jgi:hypothetical protein
MGEFAFDPFRKKIIIFTLAILANIQENLYGFSQLAQIPGNIPQGLQNSYESLIA